MLAYKNLDGWIQSRGLVKLVYEITKTFPKEEIFGLTSQMRRAAISIPLNIAEGCGRAQKKDIIHFMHISRGSLNELETALYLSLDLGYLSEDVLNQFLNKCLDCKKLLNGFIKFIERSY
ncbi:MAG: four helix bundle protein [Bacteroidetes bacterium]|nr:four helix bundle protein [Bacteroidota bacterium]MBK9525211.1 four helix bundle protein [Bacteroidota bacterium]MBK9543326.1 four helix bundle protein [Bacteroidota bacterium]MBP6402412.1 four helix bundle protein [Bacteroidia bacterium]